MLTLRDLALQRCFFLMPNVFSLILIRRLTFKGT